MQLKKEFIELSNHFNKNINEDKLLSDKRISVLMGEDVEPRKAWIEENVDFTMEDDFGKENLK